MGVKLLVKDDILDPSWRNRPYTIPIMRFIDEAKIFVKAGDGGNGCCSFRREAHEPRGGPNGGDGGRGGSIVIQADSQMGTLADFHYKKHFKAERGHHGQGKDRYGKSGEDLLLKVPVGTLIKDGEGETLADLSEIDQRFEVAKGGRGGWGNIHFATPTNRAPRRADKGLIGEERWITLELKLLADVGLIGKPNAGKSTLLSTISHARPKIADYPFTTLVPQLGVVQPFQEQGAAGKNFFSFTVADIPGLIEGAHLGTGLGHQFLKHIEKTKIFLHLLDVSDPTQDPLANYEEIRAELKASKAEFLKRTEWILLTKIDSLADRKDLTPLLGHFKKRKKKVFAISAATQEGIREMISELGEFISRQKKSDT